MPPALAYDFIGRYTYDDYVTWDGEWELIEGIAYAMSPAPYPRHQKVAFRIAKELDEHLQCDEECEVYLAPVDWKIDDQSVVQPDVAIFCENTTKRYFSQTPPVVVEVLSKATALKDVTTKFELYEKAGVRYYLIVDYESEAGKLYERCDGKFVHRQTVDKHDRIRLHWEECESAIDFAKVFSS